MPPANRDNFTSSFSIWMSFISISCLISLVRTSSTMLNKSSKSGHPCLAPDLRGKACSFSPLSIMLTVGLSYVGFIILRYSPTINSLLRVFIMMDVEFCQMLFLCLLR